MVADGSEMLLRDTAAVQRLAEENRGLFQKIRSWLRKWLENIKKAFDGVGAEHAEAKALEKHLEQLQQRWDDALVGASRNLQRSKAEAESAGEKASVRGKYWRPDLNRSEWSLLNRRLEEEIESSGQYIDESTKWLYADEKGVQVFALYGIGDGMEATPLYAVGGKQARYAASLMQDVIEEVGRSDGNAEGFDSWAENLRSKNGNYRRNYAQAGDGKPAGRNAGLHGRSQGRNTGKPAGDGKGKSSGVREKFSLRDSAGRELTAAQQEYFRDSQVRDADGNLLVMYHQTEGAFTVFDTRHKGAGTGDDETPFGIFLKRTARDIGVRGKNQM